MSESNAHLIPTEERGIIVAPSSTKYMAATFAAVALSTTRDQALVTTVNLRNALPEPFDFSDHIANTMWTVGLTGIALETINARAAKKSNNAAVWKGLLGHGSFQVGTEGDFKQRQHRLMAVAATMAIGLNLAGELNQVTTPDATDFAYGLVGGLLAYLTTKPSFINPADSEALIRSLPNDNKLKNIYIGPKPKQLKSQVDVNKPTKRPQQKRNHHHGRNAKKRR